MKLIGFATVKLVVSLLLCLLFEGVGGVPRSTSWGRVTGSPVAVSCLRCCLHVLLMALHVVHGDANVVGPNSGDDDVLLEVGGAWFGRSTGCFGVWHPRWCSSGCGVDGMGWEDLACVAALGSMWGSMLGGVPRGGGVPMPPPTHPGTLVF